MRTLYIDVYFLINFTVDLLSLYFAAIFSKIPTSIARLILSSASGALLSCFVIFLNDNTFFKIVGSGFVLLIMSLLGTKRINAIRRLRFTVSFLIFSALVGAGVYYLWGVLDKYLYDSLSSVSGQSVNRKMLIFSVIVLLSIGVFKMIVAMFSSNVSERSVLLEIVFMEKKIAVEAFVDTGNLAIDPMDMRPVLFLKKEFARTLLPESVTELSDPDLIDPHIRRRIRLIPISRGEQTHILVGIRPDKVTIIKDGKNEEILVTIAIDKEGGSFGGFNALIPASTLNDVK